MSPLYSRRYGVCSADTRLGFRIDRHGRNRALQGGLEPAVATVDIVAELDDPVGLDEAGEVEQVDAEMAGDVDALGLGGGDCLVGIVRRPFCRGEDVSGEPRRVLGGPAAVAQRPRGGPAGAPGPRAVQIN